MAVKFLIAELRTQRGMTQDELARAMNMSLNGIQHLEYRAKQISLDTLDKLCIVLNCTPGDLLKQFPNPEEANDQDDLHRLKSERMRRYWAEVKAGSRQRGGSQNRKLKAIA